MLLKHQRTVILVTQKTNLVHHSDYVNILLVNDFTSSIFSIIRPVSLSHSSHSNMATHICIQAADAVSVKHNIDFFAFFLLLLFFALSDECSFQFYMDFCYAWRLFFRTTKIKRNWFGFTTFWIILMTTTSTKMVTITVLTMTIYIHIGVRYINTHTHRQHCQIQIISMENNSIRAKGTYRVIESKDYELIQEWNSIIAKENAKDENVWYVEFGSIFFMVYLKRNGRKKEQHHEWMITIPCIQDVFLCGFRFDCALNRLCHFSDELIINNIISFVE